MNAIKAWLFPGRGTGVRFVYPEDEAATIGFDAAPAQSSADHDRQPQ